MPVDQSVRDVEKEIDDKIRDLPIWRTPRDTLLRAVLDYYRDSIEVIYAHMASKVQLGGFQGDDDFLTYIAIERDLHAGILQVLKWALAWAPAGNGEKELDAEVIMNAIQLGTAYEVFVDLLKTAENGLIALRLDRASNTITAFEGGDLTGADALMIRRQQLTNPFRTHTSLTEDDDQLTSRWKAGDYRRLVERLASLAASLENEVISTFGGRETPLFSQPTLFTVPAVDDAAEQQVLHDLTLTPDKIVGSGTWRLTSWLEVPLVQVGDERFGVSNLVKTLAMAGDDYMLRLAQRVDTAQYTRVSQLREARMVNICQGALKAEGWMVQPHYMLRNPAAEVDLLASKNGQLLVIQLKSTLRPETPWEVYKRNQDLLYGIKHTAAVKTRLSAMLGIVITDGFRGDYATWNAAEKNGIPIGSVEDIVDLARDPHGAEGLLRARVALNDPTTTVLGASDLPERVTELMGWTIRMLDAQSA